MGTSPQTRKSKQRFAASIDEAPFHAARYQGLGGHCRLHLRAYSAAAMRVRDAVLDSLSHLATFPEAGRRQSVEGVRKLVTRRYPYLVYYTVDATVGEIAILTIQHPAREREHDDA